MPAFRGKAPTLGHRAKRWLFITHRWIGIVSCLLFTIWFLSGLVMIYVPFPFLTAQERQQGQDPIDWRRVTVQPSAALAMTGVALPKAMTLEMRDRLPVWRIDPWDGAQSTIPASAGDTPAPVDAKMARRVAARFGGRQVVAIDRIERDQWTVAGSFDRHRPLWKATLAGADGAELYVSSATGGVVLNTDRRERFWNWLGSVPHWIYPTILRQDNAAWRQAVMWVSGPCIAAAVTGIWIGLLRVRLGRRRFRGGRISPYHGWMWWHHIAGLTGGLALLAWIFSGWLSVDPFRLFATAGIGTAQRIAYAGAAGPPELPVATLADIAPQARQMKIVWAAGQCLFLLDRPNAQRLVLAGKSLLPPPIDRRAMERSALRLVPRGRIVAVDRLTAPDAYWYQAGTLPTLPVVRIRFDDPGRTWVHIDPATGILLGDVDAKGRLYRWFFDLLHKWDLNGLTLNRPAWDILLWTLSLLGLVTSISGIWIGWTRLVRPRPGSHRQAETSVVAQPE